MRSRAGDANIGLQFEGERWTWAEVETEMEVRGAFLEDLLARPGRPTSGVLLDNVPEYLFMLGGAALSGCVLVGINPTRRGDELARDIRHTDCQVVVTDAGHAELLDGLDLGAATGRVIVAGSPDHEAALGRFRGPGAPARHRGARSPRTCSC